MPDRSEVLAVPRELFEKLRVSASRLATVAYNIRQRGGKLSPAELDDVGAHGAYVDDALEALRAARLSASVAAPESVKVAEERAAVHEITQECRYCGNTGWFYGDSELGYCGCEFGKVREDATALSQPIRTEGGQAPDEPGLTGVEKFLQAGRCACRGADDWCPCQNVPDRQTLLDRKENSAPPSLQKEEQP